MLPLRRKSESIMIRHLHLRQTLLIHDLFFLNHTVLEQQEGGDGVDLIGTERPFFAQRHPAMDVIPYGCCEGRVNGHVIQVVHAGSKTWHRRGRVGLWSSSFD